MYLKTLRLRTCIETEPGTDRSTRRLQATSLLLYESVSLNALGTTTGCTTAGLV